MLGKGGGAGEHDFKHKIVKVFWKKICLTLQSSSVQHCGSLHILLLHIPQGLKLLLIHGRPSLHTHLIPPSRQGSGQSGQSSHRTHWSDGLHCLHESSWLLQLTWSGQLQTGPLGYLMLMSKYREGGHSCRQSLKSVLHTQYLLQSKYYYIIYFLSLVAKWFHYSTGKDKG